MHGIVRSDQYWTAKRRLAAGQAQGRREGRLAGGHVLDLADLRKGIALCATCLPKFDQAANGYVTKKDLPYVQGRCDGCSTFNPRAHLLVHHSLANLA